MQIKTKKKIVPCKSVKSKPIGKRRAETPSRKSRKASVVHRPERRFSFGRSELLLVCFMLLLLVLVTQSDPAPVVQALLNMLRRIL
jgi:hypothetical protein